jgi:hypothetical protein
MLFSFLTSAVFADVDGAKVEAKLNEQQKEKIKETYLKGSGDLDLAVKLFRLDLAPYIKTLDRDIVTYNYRTTKEFSEKPFTDEGIDSPAAVAYANKWGVAAKQRLPNESGLFGWGLYTARDPQSSEGYGVDLENFTNIEDINNGNASFNMVTVKFEKGDKLLDLRKLTFFLPSLSKETIEAIHKVCPSFTVRYSGTPVPKKYFVQDPKCHEVYIKALDSFNIQAVIYEWNSASSSLCPDNVGGSAFVVINQKLDAKSLDYYTRLPDSALKEAKQIQSEKDPKKREAAQRKFSLGYDTFKAYEKMAAIRNKFNVGPGSGSFTKGAYMPFLSPDPKANLAYEKEFADHNFDCTKDHDDKPTYRPEQVWDVLLEDTKIIQTLDKGLKAIINNCQEH